MYDVGWFGAVSVQYEKLDGLFAEARGKKQNWAQEDAYSFLERVENRKRNN